MRRAASRSSSMCWAESLTPMGMPPVASRTSSAKRRKSSSHSKSENVAGEIASWPGSRSRTSAMRSVTLRPGEVTAGSGLGPLAELEVEGLGEGHLVHREPEATRRQLVEVATVRGLLLGEHPTLAGADPGAGRVGTRSPGPPSPPPTERRSSCRRRRSASTGHQGAVGVGPDDGIGAHGHVVEQGPASELGGDELDVVP